MIAYQSRLKLTPERERRLHDHSAHRCSGEFIRQPTDQTVASLPRQMAASRSDRDRFRRLYIKLHHCLEDGRKSENAKKMLKTEGAISISPLESTKVPKNKLKTSCF
jgi:hypothetical protein